MTAKKDYSRMWMMAVRVNWARWQDLIGTDRQGREHKLGKVEVWDNIDADVWVKTAIDGGAT